MCVRRLACGVTTLTACAFCVVLSAAARVTHHVPRYAAFDPVFLNNVEVTLHLRPLE
jgi:hypothetical protein